MEVEVVVVVEPGGHVVHVGGYGQVVQERPYGHTEVVVV